MTINPSGSDHASRAANATDSPALRAIDGWLSTRVARLLGRATAAAVNERLKPIQERRKQYEQNPQLVWDILDEGTERARKVAQETMAEVRKAVNLR